MFDVGGVLNGHMYEAGVGVNTVDEEIKSELGLTNEQITNMWANYLPALLKDEMTEVEMWQRISKKHGTRPVTDDERLIVRAFERDLERNHDVYEIVENLKKKGIKVMLLTNVTRSFADTLTRLGHYDPFETRVLSYEIGMAKPDMDIYEHALEKAGVKPEEAVFVDDAKVNIEAANKLGIHGLLFRGAEKLQKDLEKLIKK